MLATFVNSSLVILTITLQTIFFYSFVNCVAFTMMAKRSGGWFVCFCDSVIWVILMSVTEVWSWTSDLPNESMKNTIIVAGFALTWGTQELRNTWLLHPTLVFPLDSCTRAHPFHVLGYSCPPAFQAWKVTHIPTPQCCWLLILSGLNLNANLVAKLTLLSFQLESSSWLVRLNIFIYISLKVPIERIFPLFCWIIGHCYLYVGSYLHVLRKVFAQWCVLRVTLFQYALCLHIFIVP